MEAANSLKTIPVYRPTRRHTQEDCNLGIQCQLVNVFLSHMKFGFFVQWKCEFRCSELWHLTY